MKVLIFQTTAEARRASISVAEDVPDRAPQPREGLHLGYGDVLAPP